MRKTVRRNHNGKAHRERELKQNRTCNDCNRSISAHGPCYVNSWSPLFRYIFFNNKRGGGDRFSFKTSFFSIPYEWSMASVHPGHVCSNVTLFDHDTLLCYNTAALTALLPANLCHHLPCLHLPDSESKAALKSSGVQQLCFGSALVYKGEVLHCAPWCYIACCLLNPGSILEWEHWVEIVVIIVQLALLVWSC